MIRINRVLGLESFRVISIKGLIVPWLKPFIPHFYIPLSPKNGILPVL